ncbi:hypothetical protein PVNG_03206 [Plasmodium vivax North Korean]|uniref:Variable surface protein Vir18 n=1 Tax=Plasmodium vivax North Korean TaxID=1035514 RepID=A0A0J9WEG3_PLAVI|nr:hypothetical protein PVNG_03206 [Plasmodium vivax North Korean]
MTGWRGLHKGLLDSFRNYNQPQCMNKYVNYQKEIQNEISALSKRDPQKFCTNCQRIRQKIFNRYSEIKYCYDYDLLKTKLIEDDEIKDFLEKCLQPPKCSYNGVSNARNPPALKSKSGNTCRGRNVCNSVATPVQESAGKKNVSITNDPAVVQPEASDPKGSHPFSTTGHESILKQPPSASQHSLPSGLDNSSNDSSPQVNPESESSTTAIAQEMGSEAVILGNGQHSPPYVSSSAPGAQELRSTISAPQDSDNHDEKPPGGEDGSAITVGDRNSGSEVIATLVDSIIDLDGLTPLHTKITDDGAGGENYLKAVSLKAPIDVPLSDSTTGDNPQIKYKNYTAMALAPTGVIMLMTLLSKVNQNKRRNTRKDIRQNIERILLLESPAKTEESSYSFAYSPSQYWEK